MGLGTVKEAAIEIRGLTYRYGDRTAVQDLHLTVERGQIFGLLGPNGGGKTTTFNALTTRFRVPAGVVRVAGFDVAQEAAQVRRRIGVVFQSAALDPKLTVTENLRHHGHLYGLAGAELGDRVKRSLKLVGLEERPHDLVERLSGGMRRRVELAKVLLHEPEVLILDEPTTGLDPTARATIWRHLRQLRNQRGVTILLTTHLFDDAERCDRIGILDRGRLVAEGPPDELKAAVGGEVLILECDDLDDLAGRISREFPELKMSIIRDHIRAEHPNLHALVPHLMESYGSLIKSLRIGRPTLADAFFRFTGHEFGNAEASETG